MRRSAIVVNALARMGSTTITSKPMAQASWAKITAAQMPIETGTTGRNI